MHKYAKTLRDPDINSDTEAMTLNSQATSLTFVLLVAVQLILLFTCLINIRLHSALSLTAFRNSGKYFMQKCPISPTLQAV